MRPQPAALCCLALFFSGPAMAQALDLPASTSQPPPLALPGCTSVTAGTHVSYGCAAGATGALQAQARAGQARAGLDANAPSPRLGLYNQAATREQFGNQFGRSVIPQRVPPANDTAPLTPGR